MTGHILTRVRLHFFPICRLKRLWVVGLSQQTADCATGGSCVPRKGAQVTGTKPPFPLAADENPTRADVCSAEGVNGIIECLMAWVGVGGGGDNKWRQV